MQTKNVEISIEEMRAALIEMTKRERLIAPYRISSHKAELQIKEFQKMDSFKIVQWYNKFFQTV